MYSSLFYRPTEQFSEVDFDTFMDSMAAFTAEDVDNSSAISPLSSDTNSNLDSTYYDEQPNPDAITPQHTFMLPPIAAAIQEDERRFDQVSLRRDMDMQRQQALTSTMTMDLRNRGVGINSYPAPTMMSNPQFSYPGHSSSSVPPTPDLTGVNRGIVDQVAASPFHNHYYPSAVWSETNVPPPFKPKRRGSYCLHPGCPKSAQTGGLCRSHGGGSRCKHPECNKCAHKGGFCTRHGGGRRCSIKGCPKGAQAGGKCVAHGGGRRCKELNCTKLSQKGGLCARHGTEMEERNLIRIANSMGMGLGVPRTGTVGPTSPSLSLRLSGELGYPSPLLSASSGNLNEKKK